MQPDLKCPPRPRECERCHTHFPSSNKYHKHKDLCQSKNKDLVHGHHAVPAVPAKEHASKDAYRRPSVTAPVPAAESIAVPESVPAPQVVASNAPKADHTPGYAYRGYRYAMAAACIGSPANNKETVCADSGCVMSLIDRKFLVKYSPTTQIFTMQLFIQVRGLGKKLYNANQYANVDFYFPTINGCLVYFCREVYIVDDLDANALIGSDILYPEGWIINYPAQQAILS